MYHHISCKLFTILLSDYKNQHLVKFDLEIDLFLFLCHADVHVMITFLHRRYTEFIISLTIYFFKLNNTLLINSFMKYDKYKHFKIF